MLHGDNKSTYIPLLNIAREKEKTRTFRVFFSFLFSSLFPSFFEYFFYLLFCLFLFVCYFLRLSLGNNKLWMCDIYRTFLLFAYFFYSCLFFFLVFFFLLLLLLFLFLFLKTSSVITHILPSHLVSVAVFVFLCLSVHQLVCHHLSRRLSFEWWTSTPIPM